MQISNELKKPEPVNARELSNVKMSNGNVELFPRVIDDGMIKDWIGMGWVIDVAAKEEDYYKYPKVKR